jgi:hypothetical protein
MTEQEIRAYILVALARLRTGVRYTKEQAITDIAACWGTGDAERRRAMIRTALLRLRITPSYTKDQAIADMTAR